MTGNLEEAFWAGIDEHLETWPPGGGDGGEMAQHFRDAGFTDDEAKRGARMMESGRYFGFVDVATSLRPRGVGGQVGMHLVMETAVQRVAALVEGHVLQGGAGPEDVLMCEGRRISLTEAQALGYGTAQGPSKPVETYRKVDSQ